jgi:Tfp pilus assembly major pilin PilA
MTVLRRRRMIGLMIAVLVLAQAGVIAYLYSQNTYLKDHPDKVLSDRTEVIKKEITVLYQDPQYTSTVNGSEVTQTDSSAIAMVTADTLDYTKSLNLKDAQEGDYVAQYTKAGILVLYRPSEHKIISIIKSSKIAPQDVSIYVSGPSSQVDSTTSEIQQSLGNQVSISKGTDTVKQSVVVDVTGSQASAAKQLAIITGIPVGQLPAGVSVPAGTVIAIFTTVNN